MECETYYILTLPLGLYLIRGTILLRKKTQSPWLRLLISPMPGLGWQYRARGCSLSGLISSICDLCFFYGVIDWPLMSYIGKIFPVYSSFEIWICFFFFFVERLKKQHLSWINSIICSHSWRGTVGWGAKLAKQCYNITTYYICSQHGALTPQIFYPNYLQLPSYSPLNLFKFKYVFLLLTTISFDDPSYLLELLNHSQVWIKSFQNPFI